MVSFGIDARRGERRLRELKKKIQALGKTRVEINATEVLNIHSDITGKDLIREMPDGLKRSVRKRSGQIIDAAVRLSIRSRGSRIRTGPIGAAMKKAAHMYVDALYITATRGAWGRVKQQTIKRKIRHGTPASIAPHYGVRDVMRPWSESLKGNQTPRRPRGSPPYIVVTVAGKRIR